VDHVLIRNLGVRQGLKEAFILVDSHLTLFAVPDGSKGVDSLAIQLDWIGNKLREFLHNFLDDVFLAEFAAFGGKLHYDTGATLKVEVVCI
jgi:hypothetical protein